MEEQTTENQIPEKVENPDKIVNYAVVSYSSLKPFQKEVRRAIARGWEPHGGIAVSMSGNIRTYTQAFVARSGTVKELEEQREELKEMGFFKRLFFRG